MESKVVIFYLRNKLIENNEKYTKIFTDSTSIFSKC